MKNDLEADPDGALVFSYLELRKAVGVIGFALPLVVAFGKRILQGGGLEGSISYYYYTDMGNVFVGSMCAIGVFLMSTRGYDWRDAIAGRLASGFAIGVALFPTTPYVGATPQEKYIGDVHWIFAALLFLTLAYFCLGLFTETGPGNNPTRQKLKRNVVYRVCGWAILASMAAIGIIKLTATEFLDGPYKPVFWLESISVVAFGIAWLVKGETILGD
jgi:hypothetical protein